ncbi:MAG: ATPase AAA [Candidatus Sericytochromatia bacterium]|nr:MAG: ATPase AAA [Candidatus Sericytochromatia bacterium]
MQEPLWIKELKDKYLSGEGIIFILHSNILDLVPFDNKFITLKEFLINHFLPKNKETIVYYDPSEGIKFPNSSIKNNFIKELNLDQTLSGEDHISEYLPKSPSQVMPILEKFLKVTSKSSAFIFGYAETIIPNSDISYLTMEERSNLITFQRWASDIQLLNSDNLIILETENLSEINQKIVRNPQIHTIEIPLPNYQERLDFINYLLDSNKVELEMSKENFSYLCAGLKRIQIQGIIRQALRTNGKITFNLIKDKKKDIIENECFGLVELVESRYGLDDIGGLDNVKNTLFKIIKNIKEGNHRRVPMGVLLVGPMGTGKTFIAEAFSRDSGLTCLKINNFRDKWVGSTEANLEKILNIVKAIGSVIIIMDEVDRALGGQEEGDDGTSSRVYAKLKAFMSDTSNRGKIIWLLMTNRPDKVDIDLKRPGRLDLKIPFFYPQTDIEVESLLRALLKKNQISFDIQDFSLVSKKMIGFSGAEIEAITLLADEICSDRNSNVVTINDIIQALDKFIPTRDTLMLELMEYLAVFEASSKDLLPEKYKNMSNEQVNEAIRKLKLALNIR